MDLNNTTIFCYQRTKTFTPGLPSGKYHCNNSFWEPFKTIPRDAQKMRRSGVRIYILNSLITH